MIGKLTAMAGNRSRRAEADAPGRDAVQRGLFGAVGEFLADHRLASTPANYTLAHAVVTGSHPVVVRAVADATYGDIRLSQNEADAIMLKAGLAPQAASDDAGGGAAASAALALVRTIDEARLRFEQYAGIVDMSRQDAQAYGDALANEATLMPAGLSGPGTIAALLALTHSMIDKARHAEEQLRAASAEMDDLRVNLAAARADAQTDTLTGLPNRRAFEARFAEQIAAPDRPALALAVVDIDLFKAVNDRYGHDVGDRVIRLVARELADCCPTGLVARYGGEEFVILMEGEAAMSAALTLDRARAGLNRRSFRIAGTSDVLDGLSFSAGVVSVQPGEEAHDALRRADAALYRAKQGGRNRIERVA